MDESLFKRIPVKYCIIVPICLLVAICNFFVAKTLSDSIADSKLEIFTEKNITNIRAIVPTLALSIWEFNVDRVASTLSGIDDGTTFLFAAVTADKLEFSFRGDRKAYEDSLYALEHREPTTNRSGIHLIDNQVLTLRFPIVQVENNYEVGHIVAAFKLTALAGQHRETTNRVHTIAALGTGIVLLGIIIYSWFANRWLTSVADSITKIAKRQLQTHTSIKSPIAEFQDIQLALCQLRDDAAQLIELRSKARSDEKIRHMAMHDALTNLPNRRFLDEYKHQISESWRAVDNAHDWLEVLHIDLDGFKRINDSFGHGAGDRILQIAADRMHGEVKDMGRIFRVGGDEFIVIRWHRSHSPAKSEIANTFAGGMTVALGKPYLIDDQHHSVSASIGLVIFDESSLDIDSLLAEADVAMYMAKSAGKCCFVEFTQDQRVLYKKQRKLADDLDVALRTGQIQPFYQPKVNSLGYDLCGAEALVRWNHPELGILAPDQFLSLFQERGQLSDLDRLVFQQVCADIRKTEDAGYTMPTVSVNLSSSRLNDRRLLDDLISADLKPGSVSFELLETVFLDDVSNEVLDCLQVIRDAGVAIELDDFGSGHASMISLIHISPDRLKIDRRFVSGMLENAQSEKMIAMIVEIGKSMNIPATAEGVETEPEARRLAELGCDVLQGYLFGKPTDYDNFFKEFIDENQTSISTSRTSEVGSTAASANDDSLWSNTG